MSDDGQKPKKRSLSEISHLFLSNVRDRQTDGAAPPQRTPPAQGQVPPQWTPPQPAPQGPRTDESIDLTPEEFARMYGSATANPQAPAEPRRKAVPVTAILGAHLNGKQFDYVKRYARHRTSAVGRVGLVELDASELRLMCFDPAGGNAPEQDADLPLECAEPRQMSEALEELNWDVEQWIVLLPNPRTPEARALLRAIDHWTLLCTSDHDGVVSCYRMLKGLAEAARPQLALSVLDAADAAHADRVYQKLSSVCQQFLAWPLDAEPAVRAAEHVSEHLVLLYRPTRDKAQLAAAPQWAIVAEFIERARVAREEAAMVAASAQDQQMTEPNEMHDPAVLEEARALIADVGVPDEPRTPDVPLEAAPHHAPAESAVVPANAAHRDDSIVEVIDLPGADASNQTILAAVLRRAGNALIECPLRPPMCVEARLAVGRDRGLVLLVAASQGLGEMRSIANAYRWLAENRELIGMALPQFSIDARQTPRLRLLVDRADLTADALQTMLASEHVSIQAYRKIRWGERLGVFLEAA